MKITINKKIAVLVCLVVFLVIALFGVTIITPYVVGNVSNATVITKVNVTNTEPRIIKLVVYPDPIILSPGNVTKVYCNATVHDYNGWKDVANGNRNATFYDTDYNWNDANDDNYHYINASCGNCTDAGAADGTNASCSCTFYIQYYANDTTWQCNFTVADGGGAYYWNVTRRRKSLVNHNITNVTVDPLIAIDVPQSIDYGELAVTETSSMKNATLTNYGNVDINISVDGWGGDDEAQGQNLSMICRRATDGWNFANISIGWERYAYNSTMLFQDMFNLSSEETPINITLHQRINDTNITFGHDQNRTYWRIYIPPGTTGFCNGTIRFTARPTPGENIGTDY